MGMKQKVDALESALKTAERKAALVDEMHDYITTLAEMPEDAVLLYTLSGMRISHGIGSSARVLLARLNDR